MAYYPYPLSLDPLPSHLRPGLIVISVLALLSLFGTVAAASFIVYRLFNRKRYQAAPLRYNQSLILILNLLIADIQQALSFAFSLHWIRNNAILAPTGICNAQGWLVQIGDVSSGLFSLAIALQTFYIIVLQRKLEYKTFLWCVGGIWAFCLTVSLVSPLMHLGEQLFVSAGAWCWISDKYHDERLLVHYLWIFICEFGQLLLYAIISIFLRRNATLAQVSGVQTRTIQRVARLMLVYPIAYTCLTLPLAAFRMASHSRNRPPDSVLLFAGACMASCGWVDVLLYLVTRRTIVSLQQHSMVSRNTGSEGGGAAGNDIQLSRGATMYGPGTVINAGNGESDSRASSQEGFVKMQQEVQVLFEDALSPRAAAAGEGLPMGNSVNVSIGR